MINEQVKYLVLSDIHLGHPRNKTTNIIASLDVFFDHYYARDDLDIIFLAGDVFDRLLDASEDDHFEIMAWVHRLMDYCSRNSIRLRVLEGTPSHDWGQSKMFDAVYNSFTNNVDMKYVKTLSIEKMEDLGITILYVPDECNSSTDKTFEEVKELMKFERLKQVDIAIMHGNFAYQLPVQATKAPRHTEADYLAIVKYFISIGHIHTHSIYERILAQGSFDRLAHGEEEPKGGMEITIRRDGTGEYFFIENKLAKTFKTINIRKQDLDQAVALIEKQTKLFKSDSYVRVKAPKDHPIIIGFDEVKQKFPDFFMSKITVEEDVENNYQLIDMSDQTLDYTPITITKENIAKLLFDEIAIKCTLTARQHDICNRILKDHTA